MDASTGRQTNVNAPAYPHEKIDSAPSRNGQNDIEAGDKEMNIGENDLGLQSNNSSTDVYIIGEEEGSKRRSFNIYYKVGHVVLWLLMTGYESISSRCLLARLTSPQLVDHRTYSPSL